MTRHLLALWLLERFKPCDAREALIGDLVEEITQGRSRFWVWHQVLALFGFAAVARVRNQTQTAHLVAVALSLCLLGGVWIASLATVLETWVVVYFVSGAFSLFGDLISSRTPARVPVASNG
jgi:hypothetical protein